MKSRNLTIKSAMISMLVSGVTLIVFCIYGAVYDYMDTMVILSLLISAVLAFGYIKINGKVSEILNLLQVIISTYGLGLFFLNSHPVWADRLNGIDMYGARGSLVPVIIIMILFLVSILAGMISCFTRKVA